MAKCTKTPKLTTLQSTQVAQAVSYIKQGLQLSAERILKSNNLRLTKKQLLSLNESQHMSAQSRPRHRSNSVTVMGISSANSLATKCTSSLRKSGKPGSTLEKSQTIKIGKPASRTKQ